MEVTTRPPALKATKKIGSATVKTAYNPDETAFDIVDMPMKARIARKEVRRSKRANILGTEKPSWNQSTEQAGNPLCKRRNRVLQTHDRMQYKYNYRAEKLPVAAPIEVTDVVRQQFRSTMRTVSRVADIPVHPELADKATWNSSTQLTKTERAVINAKLRATAKTNSRSKQADLKDYKDPVTLEREYLEKARTLRASGIRSAGKAIAKAPEPETTSANSRSVSYTQSVSRKFHKYHHSGKYERSRFDPGNVWSCCMASDKNARGCIVTTVNPDAYNFSSIN